MFGGMQEMLYLCTRKQQGALVQLVRIHACHAWGHGFESRTHRKSFSKRGRLAQLVQSVCLTSRGSAVRIRQRPLIDKYFWYLSIFFVLNDSLC